MKYQIMFYGGLIVALISFILAVISFFKLNAAEAISDLIGVDIKSKSSSKKINRLNKNKAKKSVNDRGVEKDLNDSILKPVDISIANVPIENGLDETTYFEDEGTSIIEDEGTTMLEEENTTFLEDDKGYSENYINEYNIVFINTNKKI